MNEIDEIELAASAAEAETSARGGGSKIPLCLAPQEKTKSLKWSKREDNFVRENYGKISEEEISAELGRSVLAVHLHIVRDLHLTAPTKSPEIMTGEQVAWGIGIDGHSVHRLMDRGLMPHRKLPSVHRKVRMIERGALVRWLLEPAHWCYFKPDRVGALKSQGRRGLADCYDFQFWEDVRELVLAAAAKWRDQWLRPGEAAKIVGCSHGAKPINTAIRRGTLKATRWGNWWILRSDLPGPGLTFNTPGKIVTIESLRTRKNKKGIEK